MKSKKQTQIHTPISKNDLNILAGIHDQHCVTIYVPTSGPDEKKDKNHGQIRLKNSLKKLKQTLKAYNLSDNEIENYLTPVEDLLDDGRLWREQYGCLAIYLNKERLRFYQLPIDQDEFTYVSDHFYVLPVMPLFSDKGQFFILSLSLQNVKLFDCTPYSISEVSIEDLVPEKLEEVVGYDYQNKNLQYRSGQGGSSGAMFHGQGSGKDDKDGEIEKFLRAVDKGLMKLLRDEEAPLILACVDHYLPIYAKITNYANLFQQNIKGNHEEKDPHLLHEMAWSLVKDYFLRRRKSIAKLLMDRSSSGKTSFDLNDIIPAAIDGRIEALFIQNDRDKYGLYDIVNRSLIIDENIKANQASLYNLAAIQTWIKGGRVYLVDKEDMPFQHTSINALFRY
jgi:hypothetical protein